MQSASELIGTTDHIHADISKDLLDELIKAHRIIHVLLNNVPSEIKPAIAREGMIRAIEREIAITKALEGTKG